MIRVRIICEGQTEEEFVNNLLADHLHAYGVHPIPILIGEKGHKGGNVEYQRLRRNVRNSLRQEKTCYCTTLIDYYGLPSDFPGKSESKTKNILSDIAETFSASFDNALKSDIGENTIRRLIPYVQMHEFEALLFSDPARFAVGVGRPELQADIENSASRRIRLLSHVLHLCYPLRPRRRESIASASCIPSASPVRYGNSPILWNALYHSRV